MCSSLNSFPCDISHFYLNTCCWLHKTASPFGRLSSAPFGVNSFSAVRWYSECSLTLSPLQNGKVEAVLPLKSWLFWENEPFLNPGMFSFYVFVSKVATYCLFRVLRGIYCMVLTPTLVGTLTGSERGAWSRTARMCIRPHHV